MTARTPACANEGRESLRISRPQVEEGRMKWVTREKVHADRIACPGLISRFIDKPPTFLF